MVEFHFKQGGQVSSSILSTCCKVMKKDLKQNKKGFCVDEKWHNLCLQVEGFTVLCDKRVKDF